MCSGRREGETRVLTVAIDQERSDPQSLLLLQVWQIRLTLHYLADDGNLLDCACLAGMTALRHYRKPEVEVLGEEIIIVSQARLERQ